MIPHRFLILSTLITIAVTSVVIHIIKQLEILQEWMLLRNREIILDAGVQTHVKIT